MNLLAYLIKIGIESRNNVDAVLPKLLIAKQGTPQAAGTDQKRLFGVSDDRPVTISVVENAEKLRSILPEIRPMVKEGLIILSDVEVIM